MEHVLEFKYLGFMLDESGADGTECCRKVGNKRKTVGVITSLVNAISSQLIVQGYFIRASLYLF